MNEKTARARAARIMAERKLMVAIERAEASYEATAELGAAFERRLASSESSLRNAGYLSHDGHGGSVAPPDALPRAGPRSVVRPIYKRQITDALGP